MSVTFPAWWKGLRWDQVRLLRDLFTNPANKAAAQLSGIRVEPFPPDNESIDAWLNQSNAYLFVHRNGGQINKRTQGWVDEAIDTLAALTRSRDESHDVMDYVTTILDAYEDGGRVERSTPHRCGLTHTFMKVPGEVVAPQLIPEQFRDERLVPMVWQIHADIPRGLPDYRALLELDIEQ